MEENYRDIRITASIVASVKNPHVESDMHNMLNYRRMIKHIECQLGTVSAIHAEARNQWQELDTPRRVVDPRHVQLGQTIMRYTLR